VAETLVKSLNNSLGEVCVMLVVSYSAPARVQGILGSFSDGSQFFLLVVSSQAYLRENLSVIAI